MNDLPDFLLARVAEDEDAAKNATWSSWSAEGVRRDGHQQEWAVGAPDQDDEIGRPLVLVALGANGHADVTHAVRHDPTRVLAECEAKRRIVAAARAAANEPHGALWPPRVHMMGLSDGLAMALGFLALPYADHPDYREEWKP